MSMRFSLIKGKGMFVIDLILIPVFVLVIYSGLELHAAGHYADHEIWSYWATVHTLTSLVSLIVGGLHIKAHWNWYKGLVKRGLGKKSKVTIGVSFLFMILVITGLLLVFFISGANSAIGLWHYRLGLLMTALLVIHTISHFPLLINGLKKKSKGHSKKIPENISKTKEAA